MRRLSLLVLPLLAVALLGGGQGVAQPACTITWVGGTGSSWQTPANWNPARLPADDHVCLGGATVIYGSTTTSILTVTGTGTLSITGGTLNVTDEAEASSLFDLSLAGGTLGGAGDLAVNHTFSWTGGTMSGIGTTTIAAPATLIRSAQNTVFLSDGRLLEIIGTLDLQTDRIINGTGLVAPLIHNLGTVKKSAGAGIAQIFAAFENDGTVRSDSGTLELRAGDGAGQSAGGFGAPGAAGTLKFSAGTFDLGDGASLLGSVSVDGGNVDVAPAGTATASGANTLAAGSLGGTGTLDVTDTLTWTGGTIDDAGTTTIEADATLVRDGINTAFLGSGHLLDVVGTLDLRSDRSINVSGAVAPLLRSSGTVIKSAGAGTAQINTAFENDGSVRSDAGILELRGGDGAGTSAGDFGAVAAAPHSVRFAGGTFDLDDGASLLGGVSVEGGTVNVAPTATATASGANALASGTLGGTGTLEVDGTMSWTAASMTGAGTTRIGPAATLVRDGETTVFLSFGRLLEVQGTLDLRTDRQITPQGAASLLRNTGTVVKSAGAGIAQIATPFENDGALRSDSGTLELRGGDGPGASAGSFGAAAPTGAVKLAAETFELAHGAALLGGVSVDGATLNVVSGATAAASGANTFASGTFGGTGTLNVTGTLTWTGGSMTGAGTTRVAPPARLVRDGTNTVFLSDGRLLEVQGTLDLRNDRLLTSSGVPAPLLRSTGTVVKSAGAGTAQISAPFENDGVLRSDSGIVELRGGDGSGSSAGDFGSPGAATGSIRFGFDTYDLAAGARLLGGTTLNGGRLTVAAGATVPASGVNAFTAGLIDGPGTFRIDGPFAWTGGTMEGAGQTLVPAGVELQLTGPGCCPSLGGTRRLVNNGTIALAGPTLFASLGTLIENNATLRFAGAAVNEGIQGAGRLLNTGTIVKTGGPNPSSIDLELQNTATVRSEGGRLELHFGDGPRAQSGGFGGTGGGLVVFDSGAWDLGPGSAFNGGVAIENADLTVPAAATLPIKGTATLDFGSLLLGLGTVEIEGQLVWKGGSMEGGGTTAVEPGAIVTVDAGPDPGDAVSATAGRQLFNRGLIRFVSGGLNAFGSIVENAGAIDLQGDSFIEGGFGGGGSLLHNTGTLKKSAGAGVSPITMLIDNDGTLEATSGTLALDGALQNTSRATQSLTAGAYIARNATIELPSLPLKVNAATLVLDGPTARFQRRDFPGDPPENVLAALQRNAGAGELRLEGGADLAVPAGFGNAGLLWLGAGSTLTVPGAYVQTGGTLAVETAAGGHGRLAVGGPATVGGNLTVATRLGFVPAPGTLFRLLDAASRVGAFASLTRVAPGIDYAVEYDATGAALRVAAGSAPPAVAPAPPAATALKPVTVVDDRVFAVLSGPWTRKASLRFYDGTYTMSSRRGARLVRAGIEARQLVLLVSTCRGCGSLEAYWNGRLLKRISLQGRPVRRRVALATFPSVQTGTVVLRVASHRQVRVDGLITTR